MDFNNKSVDWAILNTVDFEKLSDVWQWASTGDAKAKNTGLLVIQSRAEFHQYMKALSSNPTYGDRRARRVTRHVDKIINHFAGIREEFRKLPITLMNVYEPEIMAARNPNKARKIDLTR